MWPNRQKTADLAQFTEEILNEKLHFLCSDINTIFKIVAPGTPKLIKLFSLKQVLEEWSYNMTAYCKIIELNKHKRDH